MIAHADFVPPESAGTLPFLGIWPNLLPTDTCLSVVTAMRACESTDGLVLQDGRETMVPDIRQCQVHSLPDADIADVRHVLACACPGVLAYFGYTSAKLEGPYFFSYPRGSF